MELTMICTRQRLIAFGARAQMPGMWLEACTFSKYVGETQKRVREKDWNDSSGFQCPWYFGLHGGRVYKASLILLNQLPLPTSSVKLTRQPDEVHALSSRSYLACRSAIPSVHRATSPRPSQPGRPTPRRGRRSPTCCTGV